MISRALLNAPFFIPKDADLLRNRKVNTKKRQNRHLPELAFLILGTYFTAPFLFWVYSLDARYTLFYLVVWIDLGIYLQMQDFMVELVHNLNGKSNKQ